MLPIFLLSSVISSKNSKTAAQFGLVAISAFFISELAIADEAAQTPVPTSSAVPWPSILTDESAKKILVDGLQGVAVANPATAPAVVKCSDANQRRKDRIIDSPTDQAFMDACGALFEMRPDAGSVAANCKSYLAIAEGIRQNSGAGACGMTDAEVAAIYTYTGYGYFNLNSALREHDSERLAKFMPMINLLNSALEKLAPYEGVVLRGASFNPVELSEFRQFNWIRSKSFISTSRLAGFQNQSRMLYYVRTCRDIHFFSKHQSEDEILCPPGLTFLVRYSDTDQSTISEKPFGFDRYHILLEEVGPELLKSLDNLGSFGLQTKTFDEHQPFVRSSP